MKLITQSLSAAILAGVLVSCESPNPSNGTVFKLEDNPRTTSSGGGSRYGYRGTEGADPTTGQPQPGNVGGTTVLDPSVPSPDPGAGGTGTNPGTTVETGGTGNTGVVTTGGGDTTPPAPSTGSTDKPYAKPVAGKYGHVYSPFAPGKEVNVEGFPPGTEVRCPYTKNIFRVP